MSEFNDHNFDSIVWNDIVDERIRQDTKWGRVRNHTPEHWLAIMVEEVGEFAKDCLEHTYYYDNMRDELIQIAAVAIAAIQDLDAQIERGDEW